MGIGTLFGWKKTSPEALKRAFVVPTTAALLAIALHFAAGKKLGFPAIVWNEPIYGGVLGDVLRAFNAITSEKWRSISSVFGIASLSARCSSIGNEGCSALM